MKPIEYAKHLYDKVDYEVNGDINNNNKKDMCVMIVDEILKHVPELEPQEVFMDDFCTVEYFISEKHLFLKKTKEEILNL